jgi:hypothetical protein
MYQESEGVYFTIMTNWLYIIRLITRLLTKEINNLTQGIASTREVGCYVLFSLAMEAIWNGMEICFFIAAICYSEIANRSML